MDGLTTGFSGSLFSKDSPCSCEGVDTGISGVSLGLKVKVGRLCYFRVGGWSTVVSG